MRTLLLSFIASLALPAGAQEFDHHDPAVLVAQARQAMREDDFPTACVLLSRAGQLAPHDVRISLAWGDYEARQRGLPIAEAAPKPVTPDPVIPKPVTPKPVTPAQAGAIPPEPPAPWPAK